MIDFRYHVVSIIAIFLALTVGVVLGTSLFNEPVIDRLGRQAQQLADDKEALRQELADLERTFRFDESVQTALTPAAVRGRLTNERVVLVTLLGADADLAEATAQVLEQAGATVTGRVEVTETWLDPEQETVLDETVTRLVPPGVRFPEGADTYGRAALVLATSLVARRAEEAGRTFEPGAAVLAGLGEGGFVEVDGSPAQRATLAVVLAGPPPEQPGERAEDDLAAQVALPVALDGQGRGTVLSGPVEAAAEGGLIAALRADDSAAEAVSTVDTGSTAAGRLAVVYALDEQAAGRAGHYGVAGTTEGPLPTGLPAPSPSPAS